MEEYTVNIDAMIDDVDTPSCVKDLYRSIKSDGYASIGEYFKQLSSDDLDTLLKHGDVITPVKNEEGEFVKQFEHTSEEFERAVNVLGRLALAMLLAEGVECSEDSFERGIQMAATFVALESLYRKGLIEVKRENWSVTYDHLEVAKMKE